jgi:hypothetical protein
VYNQGVQVIVVAGRASHRWPLVSEASPSVPELVAVECPVCYTRMHARPAKTPGKIKCPDCYTLARVPSISEVRARLPRRRAPEPEPVGTYDLGSAANPRVDETPDWPSTGAYHLQPPAAEPRDLSARGSSSNLDAPAAAPSVETRTAAPASTRQPLPPAGSRVRRAGRPRERLTTDPLRRPHLLRP